MPDYIVVCLDEDIELGRMVYVLATRQVFTDRVAAEQYAKTCATSRQPIVVEGRFRELRHADNG